MIPKSVQKAPQSRQNLIKILYLYKTPSLKVFFPIFLGLGAESDDFQAQLGLQGGWAPPHSVPTGSHQPPFLATFFCPWNFVGHQVSPKPSIAFPRASGS